MSAASQAATIRQLVGDVTKVEENSGKVIDILSRAMDPNIPLIIKELNEEEKSQVLKCIYIGLAVPENNGKLLRWFNAISESSGIGTVVRAVNSL